MRLTAHAEIRSTQRSVPHDIIDKIFVYSRPAHSRGALSILMDKEAFALAADELDKHEVNRLKRYRGVFVIVHGEIVITVARSKRRQRR